MRVLIMSIEVQTTQNVTIDYEPANMLKRIGGYIIDWMIIILWVICWFGLIIFIAFSGSINSLFDFSSSIILIYIIVFFPVFFYDLIFEYFNHGQSPGKMILKIRVIKIDGTTPSFGEYLIRWLFRIVDFTIFNNIIAVVFVCATKNSQRLGDILAGTTVINLQMDSKSQLQISNLDFHENYNVTYIDVLDRLSDRDIRTIRSVMDDPKMAEGSYFITRLAEKVKETTGYNYNCSDNAFLRKIVSDYNYLALQ